MFLCEIIFFSYLQEGEHQYKFKVDYRWIHNPRERTVTDGMGGFNNVITVDKTDIEVKKPRQCFV